MVDFTTYRPPVANAIELSVQPRLESWDKKGHPSQVALADYLGKVTPLVQPTVTALSGRSCLELVVGFEPEMSLMAGGRDLDNYLFPLVRALGPASFLSVWGTKHHGSSTLRVGSAEPQGEEELRGWSFVQAVARSSATSTAWKAEIRDQVSDQVGSVGTNEPLELQVSLRVSGDRNWSTLWKPAIDALGPILGEGARPFHPNDDRIVRLGLHRVIDPTMKWTVGVGIWWRPDAPAPSEQPRSDGFG